MDSSFESSKVLPLGYDEDKKNATTYGEKEDSAMTTRNRANVSRNQLIDYMENMRVAEVFPDFDGVHFTFENELVELGDSRYHNLNVQLARRQANNLGVWYLRMLTWPLVDVFHEPTLRILASTDSQFSAQSGNPNVGANGILGRRPTALISRNVSTVAPQNGLRYLTTNFIHSISELDISHMQYEAFRALVSSFSGPSVDTDQLDYAGLDVYNAFNSFRLKKVLKSVHSSLELDVQKLIEKTFWPLASFLVEMFIQQDRDFQVEESRGLDCSQFLESDASHRLQIPDAGLAVRRGHDTKLRLAFFIEIKPFTKQVGWGYYFYQFQATPPELLHLEGSSNFDVIKRKCVKSYLEAFRQAYLYALKYGVSHFVLFDYVYMIFFEIPDFDTVPFGERPDGDLDRINVALQPGERRVSVRVRTAVRKYDDTGSLAILGSLFAFMYHAIDSTDRLDDNTGSRRSDDGSSGNNRRESTRDRDNKLFRTIALTPAEARQKDANRTPNSRDQYQHQMEKAYYKTGSDLESLVGKFQFSVVRELLHNKVQDIRTGPDYITQTFRVKSSIVPSSEIEDKCFILKLFNYLGCEDPEYFFGMYANEEDIRRYEIIDHVKETWIYHKMVSLQGSCIPTMMEYGSMLDNSTRYESSFRRGLYMLLQDVGDVEPDSANLEHFELARASLQKIHDLGVVHGDIELRNLRIFDGKVMIFDFNRARESDNEEDYKNDFQQLCQCFERVLQVKGETTW
jgi:hypothetical protein